VKFSTDDTLLICPDCLTICIAGAAACSHCDLNLDWLLHAEAFRGALNQWAAAEACELAIEIRWADGTAQLTTAADSPVRLNTGPLGGVEIETDLSDGTWRLRNGSGTHGSSLPGEITVDGIRISVRLVVRPRSTPAVMAIGDYRDDVIVLLSGRTKSLGSGAACDVYLPDRHVSFHHCLLFRVSTDGPCWLVDSGSTEGTFVNQRPIVACRLRQGDLVQVGSYAWMFNSTAAELLPVRGLQGAKLELQDVGVRGRLKGVQCCVPPGALVAITGPSGGGKSTLIRAILEGIGHGVILADDVDIARSRDWFRSIVGYVSQNDVVHGDLTTLQALEFGAQLRRARIRPVAIERLLSQLDLTECEKKATLAGELSGGESKRLRTAVELIAEPSLLILDEPASGLDRGREKRLMRLLRTLSYRGCTVLVVTHSVHHLEDFDRVLLLCAGRQLFWGTPEQLRKLTPTGNLEDLAPAALTKPETSAVPPAAAPAQRPHADKRSWQFGKQFSTLFMREFALLANAPWRRLVVPLLLLPAFFAVSIGLAVKPLSESIHLLGFLAILACIWMGSSLSLMSIVDEREIFDHERLLFLRATPYVAAKTVALWLLSLLQTAIFVLLLVSLRTGYFPSGEYLQPLFPNTLLAWGVLTCVGLAAVGMGLLISALAGKSRPLANFILPLLMMIQIAFSVETAGQVNNTGRNRGIREFHEIYGEFTPHRCNDEGCRQRAILWKRLAAKKSQATASRSPTENDATSQPWIWTCKNSDDNSSPGNDDLYCPYRPNILATYGSYLTISRYGDILLRSHEGEQSNGEESSAAKTFDYRAWRREAWASLLYAAGACHSNPPSARGDIPRNANTLSARLRLAPYSTEAAQRRLGQNAAARK
jgi:ABC-type multidrug transport system ATPase subunit